MKLKVLESNYPCRCGHHENKHGTITGKPVCWQCHDEYNGTHVLHEFVADNLKYLEIKADEKLY